MLLAVLGRHDRDDRALSHDEQRRGASGREAVGEGGGTALELSSFERPAHTPGSPNAISTELGLRNVAFEVDDIQSIVDKLAADGFGLVGGIGQYEDMWLMAYVRGPEGIVVALAERLGADR